MSLHPAFAAADWPRAAHADRAQRERDRFLDAAREGGPDLADFAAMLAADKTGSCLLDAVFGNSPYLSEILVQQAGFARMLLTAGPDQAMGGLLDSLRRLRVDRESNARSLMPLLRVAKRHAALTIALADVADLWPLEKITGALSDFADFAIDTAIAPLLREAAARGAIRL